MLRLFPGASWWDIWGHFSLLCVVDSLGCEEMADSVKTFLQDLARVSMSSHLLTLLLQELTRKSFRYFWNFYYICWVLHLQVFILIHTARGRGIILHLAEAWENCLVSVCSIETLFSLAPDPLFFFFLTLFINIFFFWPCCTACGILVPRPGIEPQPLAVRVWSPNHCTAGEFPKLYFGIILELQGCTENSPISFTRFS